MKSSKQDNKGKVVKWMRFISNKGFAVLLVVCGVLILLDKVGLGLGSLMGFLISITMMVCGYIGIRGDKKVIGWVLFIIGLMILLAGSSGLIGFLLALGLVLCGMSLLKRSTNVN
jgi:lia operon protein LiaI